MKNLIVLTISLLNLALGLAEDLSFEKLQLLSKTDWVEIGDYLESENWKQISSSKSDEGESVVWMNQEGYSLRYNKLKSNVCIVYGTSRNMFLQMKMSIVSSGYQRSDSQIGDDYTSVDYLKDSIYIKTIQQTGANENYYLIFSASPIILNENWLHSYELYDADGPDVIRQKANRAANVFKKNCSVNSYGYGANIWSLAGRQIQGTLPRPAYTVNEEGYIIVDIAVDNDGNVVSAEIKKSFGITSPALHNAAISAAKKAKFSKMDGFKTNQKGTITYNFKLQ